MCYNLTNIDIIKLYNLFRDKIIVYNTLGFDIYNELQFIMNINMAYFKSQFALNNFKNLLKNVSDWNENLREIMILWIKQKQLSLFTFQYSSVLWGEGESWA